MKKDEKYVRIMGLGDICPSLSGTEILEKNIFEATPPEYWEADLRIGNLECSIIKGHEKRIHKTGPNLCMKEEDIGIIKNLHLDVVTLANNHTGDFGESGIRSTREFLEEWEISSVGTGDNLEKSYSPLRVEKSGIKISIVSVCENEFGCASLMSAGVAGFSLNHIMETIDAERKAGFEVIVFFHGGNEFNPLPSPGMQYRYRAIIDMGARLVVGTHTHCVQGYEMYHSGLILYSLGNFFFPHKEKVEETDPWNIGYIADIRLGEDNIDFAPIPVRYSPECKRVIPLKKKEVFQRYIQRLNEVISNTKVLDEFFSAWSVFQGERYAVRLRWEKDRYTSDELIRQSIEIQNLFRCEAHREMMQRYFEIWSNGKQNAYEECWKELQSLQHQISEVV